MSSVDCNKDVFAYRIEIMLRLSWFLWSLRLFLLTVPSGFLWVFFFNVFVDRLRFCLRLLTCFSYVI